jgi:hypothetical protein
MIKPPLRYCAWFSLIENLFENANLVMLEDAVVNLSFLRRGMSALARFLYQRSLARDETVFEFTHSSHQG